MKLIEVNPEELLEYLLQTDAPVMEFDLIKKFIHTDASLYEKHFSLYHSLYIVKFLAGGEGLYVNTDPMRISIVPVPPDGRCRHFNAETGKYCCCETSGTYCPDHQSMHSGEENSAEPDFLSSFYTDPENIAFGESEKLHSASKGFSIYLLKKKDIDEALKLFDLKSPGRTAVKTRYRELVRKYHPDRDGGSEEMIKRINGSYDLLTNALPYL